MNISSALQMFSIKADGEEMFGHAVLSAQLIQLFFSLECRHAVSITVSFLYD